MNDDDNDDDDTPVHRREAEWQGVTLRSDGCAGVRGGGVAIVMAVAARGRGIGDARPSRTPSLRTPVIAATGREEERVSQRGGCGREDVVGRGMVVARGGVVGRGEVAWWAEEGVRTWERGVVGRTEVEGRVNLVSRGRGEVVSRGAG